jgi:hypothetical protein
MRSKAALSLRLSLFLVTAPPTVPGTVMPTRLPVPTAAPGATNTVIPSRRALDPLSRTRRKSSLLFNDRTAAPTTTVPERHTQADSRARPLARRFFRIARPPRVRIRARNPCFRLRRRVLG